jgi:hypothetical protein
LQFGVGLHGGGSAKKSRQGVECVVHLVGLSFRFHPLSPYLSTSIYLVTGNLVNIYFRKFWLFQRLLNFFTALLPGDGPGLSRTRQT